MITLCVKIKPFAILLVLAGFFLGCSGKIVNITSDPTGADVYANRDLIGKTPLKSSTDEIMPNWSSDGTFTRACITVKKTGFADYKVFVNEVTLPDLIHATLVPLRAEGYSQPR